MAQTPSRKDTITPDFQDSEAPSPTTSSRRSTTADCDDCLCNNDNADDAVRAAPGRAETRFEDVYEPIAGSTCGYGSTSVVVQVRRRSDGRVFACKVCYISDDQHSVSGDTNNKCKTSPQGSHQIRREIEIMNKLRALRLSQGACSVDDSGSYTNDDFDCDISHCHSGGIAMLVDAFVESSGGRYCDSQPTTVVYMVSELMKGGDLQSALQERGSYAEDDARAVMKQLLRSLVFLHDDAAGITHRDIKLENILLQSEFDPTKIKLTDFGLSAAGTSASPSMTQCCGTPAYVAPEVLERTPDRLYSNKVDLWSSGVVLFMLLSGYPPFLMGTKMSELLRSILEARPNFNDPVWELVSEEAKDLVQKLLTKDPRERLSAREALLHPWLAEAQ